VRAQVRSGGKSPQSPYSVPASQIAANMEDLPASVVSPSQASRIELAIRRYEEEIQNICKSNAQLRASFQTRPNSFAQSLPIRPEESLPRYEPRAEELRLRPVGEVRGREALAEARKTQQRIADLEDYVETLENKLRAKPIAQESVPSAELTALKNAVSLQRDENDLLKDQVESLSQACREAEQRLRLVSTDQTSWQRHQSQVESTLNQLQADLQRTTEERNQAEEELQSLKSRYQQLQAEYATVMRTKGSDSAVVQGKIEGLEGELAHYRALAGQREQENIRMAERLRAYVKDIQAHEEVQDELKYRLEMLETRNLLAKSSSGDLESRPRREKPGSESSDRQKSSDRRSDSSKPKNSDSLRRSRDISSKSANFEAESKPTAPRSKAGKAGEAAKGGRKRSKDRA